MSRQVQRNRNDIYRNVTSYARRDSYYEDEYQYGSAAQKRQYEDEQEDDRLQLKQPSRKSQNIARRNREKAAHMNPGYLVFMVLLMSAMCVVLISYIRLQSSLTSSVSDINTLESQLNTLKAANDEKYNAINSSIDLEEIKTEALTRLGMNYADKDQIVTYSNSTDDYVKQVASPEE